MKWQYGFVQTMQQIYVHLYWYKHEYTKLNDVAGMVAQLLNFHDLK